MKQYFLICSILLLAQATQYVPLPSKSPGLVACNNSAELVIQFVYDPMCDDTTQFDKNVVKDLIDQLDQSVCSQVKFVFELLALPYHITAHKVVASIIYLRDKHGDDKALDLLRQYLYNQNSWNRYAIRNSTISDFMDKMASEISEKYDLDEEDLRKNIMHYSEYEKKVRAWTKFILGAQRTPGTPYVLINNVPVDNGVNLTKQQWKDLIDSLLGNTSSE